MICYKVSESPEIGEYVETWWYKQGDEALEFLEPSHVRDLSAQVGAEEHPRCDLLFIHVTGGYTDFLGVDEVEAELEFDMCRIR